MYLNKLSGTPLPNGSAQKEPRTPESRENPREEGPIIFPNPSARGNSSPKGSEIAPPQLRESIPIYDTNVSSPSPENGYRFSQTEALSFQTFRNSGNDSRVGAGALVVSSEAPSEQPSTEKPQVLKWKPEAPSFVPRYQRRDASEPLDFSGQVVEEDPKSEIHAVEFLFREDDLSHSPKMQSGPSTDECNDSFLFPFVSATAQNSRGESAVDSRWPKDDECTKAFVHLKPLFDGDSCLEKTQEKMEGCNTEKALSLPMKDSEVQDLFGFSVGVDSSENYEEKTNTAFQETALPILRRQEPISAQEDQKASVKESEHSDDIERALELWRALQVAAKEKQKEVGEKNPQVMIRAFLDKPEFVFPSSKRTDLLKGKGDENGEHRYFSSDFNFCWDGGSEEKENEMVDVEKSALCQGDGDGIQAAIRKWKAPTPRTLANFFPDESLQTNPLVKAASSDDTSPKGESIDVIGISNRKKHLYVQKRNHKKSENDRKSALSTLPAFHSNAPKEELYGPSQGKRGVKYHEGKRSNTQNTVLGASSFQKDKSAVAKEKFNGVLQGKEKVKPNDKCKAKLFAAAHDIPGEMSALQTIRNAVEKGIGTPLLLSTISSFSDEQKVSLAEVFLGKKAAEMQVVVEDVNPVDRLLRRLLEEGKEECEASGGEAEGMQGFSGNKEVFEGPLSAWFALDAEGKMLLIAKLSEKSGERMHPRVEFFEEVFTGLKELSEKQEAELPAALLENDAQVEQDIDEVKRLFPKISLGLTEGAKGVLRQMLLGERSAVQQAVAAGVGVFNEIISSLRKKISMLSQKNQGKRKKKEQSSLQENLQLILGMLQGVLKGQPALSARWPLFLSGILHQHVPLCAACVGRVSDFVDIFEAVWAVSGETDEKRRKIAEMLDPFSPSKMTLWQRFASQNALKEIIHPDWLEESANRKEGMRLNTAGYLQAQAAGRGGDFVFLPQEKAKGNANECFAKIMIRLGYFELLYPNRRSAAGDKREAMLPWLIFVLGYLPEPCQKAYLNAPLIPQDALAAEQAVAQTQVDDFLDRVLSKAGKVLWDKSEKHPLVFDQKLWEYFLRNLLSVDLMLSKESLRKAAKMLLFLAEKGLWDRVVGKMNDRHSLSGFPEELLTLERLFWTEWLSDASLILQFLLKGWTMSRPHKFKNFFSKLRGKPKHVEDFDDQSIAALIFYMRKGEVGEVEIDAFLTQTPCHELSPQKRRDLLKAMQQTLEFLEEKRVESCVIETPLEQGLEGGKDECARRQMAELETEFSKRLLEKAKRVKSEDRERWGALNIPAPLRQEAGATAGDGEEERQEECSPQSDRLEATVISASADVLDQHTVSKQVKEENKATKTLSAMPESHSQPRSAAQPAASDSLFPLTSQHKKKRVVESAKIQAAVEERERKKKLAQPAELERKPIDLSKFLDAAEKSVVGFSDLLQSLDYTAYTEVLAEMLRQGSGTGFEKIMDALRKTFLSQRDSAPEKNRQAFGAILAQMTETLLRLAGIKEDGLLTVDYQASSLGNYFENCHRNLQLSEEQRWVYQMFDQWMICKGEMKGEEALFEEIEHLLVAKGCRLERLFQAKAYRWLSRPFDKEKGLHHPWFLQGGCVVPIWGKVVRDRVLKGDFLDRFKVLTCNSEVKRASDNACLKDAKGGPATAVNKSCNSRKLAERRSNREYAAIELVESHAKLSYIEASELVLYFASPSGLSEDEKYYMAKMWGMLENWFSENKGKDRSFLRKIKNMLKKKIEEEKWDASVFEEVESLAKAYKKYEAVVCRPNQSEEKTKFLDALENKGCDAAMDLLHRWEELWKREGEEKYLEKFSTLMGGGPAWPPEASYVLYRGGVVQEIINRLADVEYRTEEVCLRRKELYVKSLEALFLYPQSESFLLLQQSRMISKLPSHHLVVILRGIAQKNKEHFKIFLKPLPGGMSFAFKLFRKIILSKMEEVFNLSNKAIRPNWRSVFSDEFIKYMDFNNPPKLPSKETNSFKAEVSRIVHAAFVEIKDFSKDFSEELKQDEFIPDYFSGLMAVPLLWSAHHAGAMENGLPWWRETVLLPGKLRKPSFASVVVANYASSYLSLKEQSIDKDRMDSLGWHNRFLSYFCDQVSAADFFRDIAIDLKEIPDRFYLPFIVGFGTENPLEKLLGFLKESEVSSLIDAFLSAFSYHEEKCFKDPKLLKFQEIMLPKLAKNLRLLPKDDAPEGYSFDQVKGIVNGKLASRPSVAVAENTFSDEKGGFESHDSLKT